MATIYKLNQAARVIDKKLNLAETKNLLTNAIFTENQLFNTSGYSNNNAYNTYSDIFINEAETYLIYKTCSSVYAIINGVAVKKASNEDRSFIITEDELAYGAVEIVVNEYKTATKVYEVQAIYSNKYSFAQVEPKGSYSISKNFIEPEALLSRELTSPSKNVHSIYGHLEINDVIVGTTFKTIQNIIPIWTGKNTNTISSFDQISLVHNLGSSTSMQPVYKSDTPIHGGTIDWQSGKLISNYTSVTFDENTVWTSSSTSSSTGGKLRFYTILPVKPYLTQDPAVEGKEIASAMSYTKDGVNKVYKLSRTTPNANYAATEGYAINHVGSSTTAVRFYVYIPASTLIMMGIISDLSVTITADHIKQAMNGVQLVYEVAEPTIIDIGKSYQFTATEGINTFDCTIGDVYVDYHYNIDDMPNFIKDTVKFDYEKYAVPTDYYGADLSIPIVYFDGDISEMSKDNAVTLNYKYKDKTGTCTLKWQGNSSLKYPKKNYTVKFDNKFEAATGWGNEKKYCLKANFIDHSHARNVVAAKLWGQIIKYRTGTDEITKNLKKLVNGGAIDGFPVMIVINGEYMGLYTFNIPKDGYMMGMGDGEKECIVCADTQVASNSFKGEIDVWDNDGEGDFSLEYITDEDNTEWAKDAINDLINLCINSDGTDLDTTIAQYLDWNSAIDYYIFTVLLGGVDMMTKNYLLCTFDGTKWFFSAYDMDAIFGLSWNGATIYNSDSGTTFANFANRHRVMELIKTYKKDALKARYQSLRAGALSEDTVATKFGNFIGSIPKQVYDSDLDLWRIPSSSVNNYSQIMDWYRRRVAAMDAEINAM